MVRCGWRLRRNFLSLDFNESDEFKKPRSLPHREITEITITYEQGTVASWRQSHSIQHKKSIEPKNFDAGQKNLGKMIIFQDFHYFLGSLKLTNGMAKELGLGRITVDFS